MLDLKELLWDGLSFSGDMLCKTATIVPRKSKSEMDKKTLHYLFYLASHQNIRNEMVFSVTEKDLADLGVEAYDVIDCLCDLSYCNGVINGMLHPVVRRLCEEISVKTKTVIKMLLWSGMKNLPLLFIYSIQRIL